MKINQKGFSAVEGLLVLVILGILGFVGWYVMDQNKDSEKDPASITNQQSAQFNEADFTDYPDQKDWVNSSNEGVGFSYSVALPKDVKATIDKTTKTGLGPQNGFYLTGKQTSFLPIRFVAVLDPAFRDEHMEGQDNIAKAWQIFESKGLQEVAEFSRQASIKSNQSSKYMKNGHVGPLTKIKIAKGEAWGYVVTKGYYDLVAQSEGVVEYPTTVIFVSNGKAVLSGDMPANSQVMTNILKSLELSQ